MKSILIIEDEIVVARNIEQILLKNGYDVIGIAVNTKQAKQLIQSFNLDLILCDINLNEEKTGLDFIEDIRNSYDIPYIFISSYSDKYTLERANKLTPCNYITKPFNEKQLITSVSSIFMNKKVDSTAPTERELAILRLISKGKNTKQIALYLNISFNTVESHRKNLMRKYNVSSMPELICLATFNSWISYDNA